MMMIKVNLIRVKLMALTVGRFAAAAAAAERHVLLSVPADCRPKQIDN